jgi:FAD/FMN-containing dehydrogenase
MAKAITTFGELQKQLEGIVGKKKVLTDGAVLDEYCKDESFVSPRRPDCVVQAKSTQEVQKIVLLANEHAIPVIPRSSKVGFYGSGIPAEGGIVVDLSPMNKILRVDERNRWVMIQPGVTYGQLQSELGKRGFQVMFPLLPHREKSVVTSTLDKEPNLVTKMHLDETINTMEIVLPTGELFRTGSLAMPSSAPEKTPDEAISDLCNWAGPGIDWYRLMTGTEGTLGIITTMTIRMMHIPKVRKLFFIPFQDVESAVEPTYLIQRREIGNECFLLSALTLASLLAEEAGDIEKLRSVLPPYTLILCLAAGDWYPEQKIAYQEEALFEMADDFHIEPATTLPRVAEADHAMRNMFTRQWEGDPYWKSRVKGASQSLIFLSPMRRVPEFLRVAREVAGKHDYPFSDVGVYVQPKQRAHAIHVELHLHYDPEDLSAVDRVKALFLAASEELIDQGAFFYRPYGPWAQMVYSRAGNLLPTIKKVKGILDPVNVMNPGRLGM